MVAVRPDGQGRVAFLDLAMALHFTSINANPAEENADVRPDLFATPFITQGLERGLTPDRVRRRWLNTPAYRSFLAAREEVLLYEP